MNKLAGRWIVVALLGLAVAAAGWAQETVTEQAAMRGFGNVTVTARFYGDGANRSSWVTFTCEDAAHATILGSKYMADLQGFGEVQPFLEQQSGPQGETATRLMLPGTGKWALALEGKNFHVLFTRGKDLVPLEERAEAYRWKPVPARAYPRYLDCWDNAGTATWWGGGGMSVELPQDFQWAKDHNFALCNQPPNDARYVAPGVVDSSITDWFGAMCRQYDIPYRTLKWGNKPEWEWNRAPLPYLQPVPGLLGQDNLYYERYLISSGPAYAPISVPATNTWSMDFLRRLSAGMNGDPNLMGGHALGEVPDGGVLELAAVAGTPQVKTWWHEYLQKTLGWDLRQVGVQHLGRADAYKSWDEVQVPTARDFLGWNDQCLDLTGTWEGLADREKAGIAAQWYLPEKAPQGWTAVNCNDPMLLIYGAGGPAERRADYWLRRTVRVTAAQAGRLKYLHLARAIWPGKPSDYGQAYLNGTALALVGKDEGCFDACLAVEGLHAGDNQLVLCMHGGPPVGYVFLGATPLRLYPNMTEPENRLWYDTVNFSASLLMKNLENVLVATRQGDPNRPQKVMATIDMLDLSQGLCAKYGAYQHDTGGAGGYWCPMSGARLAKTHGLPWSCEQGGPPNSVADMQSAMTFYLMYGNDAVDLVFSVSAYRDKPDVSAWVEQNLALMHCIGKLDLPMPPIAILRSTRACRMGFGEPWNWDVGRGALQGVGRNFTYVEIPDIASGLISRFPVVIDDGTVLMTDEDVAGIKRYVAGGGIFIAQHHTGRHTPSRADAWPLAAAFGLKVEPKLITPENFNGWPLGKITFTADETLLPSLKGKTCEGSGVAIDYLDQAHTGAVGLSAAGAGVLPVARWADGTMAVADIHVGKGRLIYLGTEFYLRMRDDLGKWVNEQDREALLDEMLTGLGVPRDSWTGNGDLWAEHWVSKNGLYDLYPVARMAKRGDESVPDAPVLRRATAVSEVVEMSANGHPHRPVTWQDGKMTLPQEGYTPMQYRLYAAPRADVERAPLEWFSVQQRLWRALPPVPPPAPAEVVQTPEDILPLLEGWRMATGPQTAEDWVQPGYADGAWKTVKLGSFAALSLPEDSVAQFRKEIPLPAAWKGRKVELVFDAEWSWGIGQQGKLWINGAPAAIRQPISMSGNDAFILDVTDQAAAGKLTLAVQADGHQVNPARPAGRPAGVTGAFYLQGEPPPVATTPLAGPWSAVTDVNVLTPAEVGKTAKYVYLETRFTLPQNWPGRRVSLESPGPLGMVILNGQVVQMPYWLHRLDISGLVRRTGENVLQWAPVNNVPSYDHVTTGVVPEAELVWDK